MKKYILFVILIHFSVSSQCQESNRWTIMPALIGGVFPNFEYDLKNYNPLLIPYLPFSKGSFYGELRYNYDRNGTFGIYGGKSWSLGENTIHLITPQLGALFGDYKGVSLQFYYNLISPHVEFNLTNNYALITNNRPNFYFNWTDIQFPVWKKGRIGASTQIFVDSTIQTYDFGPMIGYRNEKWYFMLTSFNPWHPEKHYLFFAIQRTLQL